MRTLRVLLIAVTSLLSVSSVDAKEPASAKDQPITKKNWLKHPAIVEVRKLFQANEAAAKDGTLKPENKPVCEQPALETERTAYRDASGNIRKYVTGGGSDDSAYSIEHHYDEKGRLRFVFARSGAVNDSTVEHRLYFSVDGKQLWHDRKATGIGYTWIPDWPERYLVRDPSAAWKAKPEDCPPGREL